MALVPHVNYSLRSRVSRGMVPPMLLARWIGRDRGRMAELARKIGRNATTVQRIVRGERGCSLALALSIEKATGGEVTAPELPLSPESRSVLEALSVSACDSTAPEAERATG